MVPLNRQSPSPPCRGLRSGELIDQKHALNQTFYFFLKYPFTNTRVADDNQNHNNSN